MEILVLGGGIAGLSCARQLLVRGHDVLVLEEGERIGGYVHTGDLDGAILEYGPQGFLGERPGVLDVVDELGLTDRLLPAAEVAKTRWILWDGQLCALGPGILFNSPLLSLGGRLRLLGEPFAARPPDEPESIREFAIRRVGAEAADRLIDAAVTGIFAGDPAKLSVDACFPKMRALESEYGGLIVGMIRKKLKGGAANPAGSRLHSFVGGMEDLVRATARTLDGKIRLDTGASSLEKRDAGWRATLASGETVEAEGVVVALPSEKAGAALSSAAPAITAALGELESAAAAVVGLVYRRDGVEHPLNGYGFLVPGGTAPILGCLFESSVFPNRAPADHVLLRAIVGGARNREAALEEPDRIVDSARRFLEPLLGIARAPEAARCVTHEAAIPQYDVRHPERLRRIETETARLPGLQITGAATTGVSVNHLVAISSQVADRFDG